MASLPSGTVTFLFTDIEGSTRLAQQFPDTFSSLLERHHAILQHAIESHGGHIFQIVGDAFCAAFPTAWQAVEAAVAAQRSLSIEPWSPESIRVRMGISTGVAQVQLSKGQSPRYVGYLSLARVQRVMSVAYGGQILLEDASRALVSGQLPGGISLRDMGEHRLKGLLNPEHLWQVLSPNLQRDFPPLKSRHTIPDNLPLQLTSFVGRDAEARQIDELLRREDVRLITLTGPGGSGKTRLALELAARSRSAFRDGICFVDLSTIRDPEFVVPKIAQTLDLKAEKLSEALYGKEILILLDNVEQVTQAAPAIAKLLGACPGVKVLATSRELLRVRGEHEVSVLPLGLPDPRKDLGPAKLAKYPAVELFVQRAQTANAEFRLDEQNAHYIAAICQRLDGLPLAIELAAVRIKQFQPEALLKRLDNRLKYLNLGARDLPDRQKTLRAALDWSYALLDPPEQELLAHLSIFSGGGTLESIQEITSRAGKAHPVLLDELTSLENKSMVRQVDSQDGELRFGMLETIREYAREKLETNGGAEELRRSHALHYLDLAEEAEQQHATPAYTTLLGRLEMERDNLREALRWSSIADARGIYLRLAGALWRFWSTRGPIAEGRAWLDQAIELCNQDASVSDAAVRMRIFIGASELARSQGDHHLALQWKEHVLAVCRERGDGWSEAAILHDLAIIHAELGDGDQALGLAQEALALRRNLGSPLGIAHALEGLSFVLMCNENAEAARAALHESLEINRAEQNHGGLVTDLSASVYVAIFQQQYDEAYSILEELLPSVLEFEDQVAITECFYISGILAAAQGRSRQAARLLGAAEQLMMLSELQLDIPARAWMERTTVRAKKRIGDHVWKTEYQAGREQVEGAADLTETLGILKDALDSLANGQLT